MDEEQIIFEHKVKENKKLFDVTDMIYDIFETYQVSDESAIYLLTRMIHDINMTIDSEMEELNNELNNEINEDDNQD